MFNKKLKKEIKKLKSQVTSIEIRLWELQNPPEYKLGDNVKVEETIPGTDRTLKYEAVVIGTKVDRDFPYLCRDYEVLRRDRKMKTWISDYLIMEKL